MRVVLIIFLLLQVVACSSNKTKNMNNEKLEKSVRTYDESPQYFSTAEQIAWNRYQEYLSAGMQHNEAMVMLRRYNGSRVSNENSESLRIEANQMIDYFCIVNEGNGRFQETKSCKQWGQSVHLRCEVFQFGNYSSRVIRCLEKELARKK